MTLRTIISGKRSAINMDMWYEMNATPTLKMERKVYKDGSNEIEKLGKRMGAKKLRNKYQLLDEYLADLRKILILNMIEANNDDTLKLPVEKK